MLCIADDGRACQYLHLSGVNYSVEYLLTTSFTSPFALFLPFSSLHTLSSANIFGSIEKIYAQLIIIQVFSGKVRMTTKNSWEKRSQDSYCFALKIMVLLNS